MKKKEIFGIIGLVIGIALTWIYILSGVDCKNSCWILCGKPCNPIWDATWHYEGLFHPYTVINPIYIALTLVILTMVIFFIP